MVQMNKHIKNLLINHASGYFIDPLNFTGTVWNNSSNAQYHTQSTRTRAFGDGATGGLDDRFDMISNVAGNYELRRNYILFPVRTMFMEMMESL